MREELGEAGCRETAPGTPSPGTWPLGPPRGPALPGVTRPHHPTLQLCVPRRVGCRISSQALAACSVFPNPPVGEGGSPVRIRVPPPPAPAGPPLPASFFQPPHRLQTPFPFRPWTLRPPAPPSLPPEFQVQAGGGPGGSHSLRKALGEATHNRRTTPRPAGRRPDCQPGARRVSGLGPRATFRWPAALGSPGPSGPGWTWRWGRRRCQTPGAGFEEGAKCARLLCNNHQLSGSQEARIRSSSKAQEGGLHQGGRASAAQL